MTSAAVASIAVDERKPQGKIRKLVDSKAKTAFLLLVGSDHSYNHPGHAHWKSMVRVFWLTRKVNHCLCVQRPRSPTTAARAFASLHKGASEKVQAQQHVATKPVLQMLPPPTKPFLLCIFKFPSIASAGSLCICVVH